MLPLRKRWHNASKRAPEKEARLCYKGFTSPDGRPSGEEREKAKAEKPEKDGAAETIQKESNDTKEAIKGALEKEKADAKKKAEEEELRAVQESELLANKTAENMKTIDDFFRKYRIMMKEVKDFSNFIDQAPIRKLARNEEDIDAFYEMKDMIDKEQARANMWAAIKDDMKLWNSGQMSPAVFLTKLKDITKDDEGNIPEEIKKVEEYVQLKQQDIDAFEPREHMQETEDAIKQWKSENMLPSVFVQQMSQYFTDNNIANGPQMISQMNNALEEHHEQVRLWEVGGSEAIGASDRITIVQKVLDSVQAGQIVERIRKNKRVIGDINRIIDMDAFLTHILSDVSDRKSAFDSMKIFLDKKADKERETEQEAHADGGDHEHGHGNSLLEMFNVEFYSINEVLGAFKEIQEAYMEAWHNHTHHKIAGLAANLGESLAVLPYGNAAIVALDKRKIAADDKQKGEYAEMLKSRHPDLDALLLDDNSFMKQAQGQHDANFARAVFEYAAEKGWLYDLDKNAQRGSRKTMGFDIDHLLHDWDEKRIKDYYHSLRGQNQGGLESEIKHAHDGVQNISNVPFFIQEIDHQFHEKNLWGVVGIAQRAMERGLEGEVGPWVATRVMRFSREHPKVMQQISSDAFWDKLGALFLYHTANTAGLFKVQRKALDAQAERGEMDKIENAGMLGNIIVRAENHIKQQSGLTFETDEEKSALDRLVARLLAGQIVEVKDKHGVNMATLSIFEQEFDDYTHHERGQGEVHPDKEDEDYYREISDNILADTSVVKAILDLTGSGTFKSESRAKAYIHNILKMPEQLEAKGLDGAAENFRRVTGEKLTEYLGGWLKDSRSEPLTNAKIDGKPMAALLITKGFVSKQLLIDALTQKWGNEKLAKGILRDVDPNHPLAQVK